MAYWLSEPGADNNPVHHIPTAEAMSYRPFDPRAGEFDLESGWAINPETGKPRSGDESHTFSDLHSSIAEHGVQSPVEIFTDGENAMMFDGIHRTTVAHELGHPTIPAYIHHMSPADLLVYQDDMGWGNWTPRMDKVGEGVQSALSGPNPPVMHPPWWIHTNSPPDVLGGQAKNRAYEQQWRNHKRQSRTASTDGVRYAHIVEADVAEDLRRLAMPQPLPQGVYFRYHPELMWSPGVTAHLPGGKQVGSLEWYDDDHVMVDLGSRKPGEIDRIGVHPDHQGQSIATSMFDFAKQYEPRLHHSETLTDDGRGWSAYEKARHARLAMAWDHWAPQVRKWGGEDMGSIWNSVTRSTHGTYIIDHPEQPFVTQFDSLPEGHGFSALSYTVHPTEPEVKIGLIHTHPAHRKDGVAEALMRRLHEDFPDHRIDPGQMMPDGQAFHDRMLEKEPSARDVVTAGKNGPTPPLTFEPFNTMWSNGIMARHAEDGRPVGHLHWVPSGEIDSITVHPELQRRGIGKAMLDHARSHPDRYRSSYPIFHSQHLTNAGRAWAAADGHNPPEETIYKADDNPANWGFTAVDQYTPLSERYNGQNEDEMSRHLEQPWTPPTRTAASGGDGWPVWWQGRHRPAGDFDERWSPNHPQHVPAPWES